MLNFLFWNIQRKSLGKYIGVLARIHRLDMIILAECDASEVEKIEAQLNTLDDSAYEYVPYHELTTDKIKIFVKFPAHLLQPQVGGEGQRWTVWKLNLPHAGQQTDILLAITHMISKYPSTSSTSQYHESGKLIRDIEKAEQIAKHKRTIIIGDMNMYPFEDGIAEYGGINAVMTRQLALKKDRKKNGTKYSYFYNPMWGLLGDNTSGPPGSYYYQNSTTMWHMYDQVLLRPALLDYFNFSSLRILDEIEGENLLSKIDKKPNAKKFSDHLPIVFSLDL